MKEWRKVSTKCWDESLVLLAPFLQAAEDVTAPDPSTSEAGVSPAARPPGNQSRLVHAVEKCPYRCRGWRVGRYDRRHHRRRRLGGGRNHCVAGRSSCRGRGRRHRRAVGLAFVEPKPSNSESCKPSSRRSTGIHPRYVNTSETTSSMSTFPPARSARSRNSFNLWKQPSTIS